MRVQFNRPVTLSLMILGALSVMTFGKGVHPVPVEAKDDWYFKALRQDGDIVVLSEDEAAQLDNSGKEAEGDLLEGNAKDIAAALEAGGLTAEELNALAEREAAGKDRKTVKEAIVEALKVLAG